jgi:hypothetical protein
LIGAKNTASIRTAEKVGFQFERSVEIDGASTRIYSVTQCRTKFRRLHPGHLAGLVLRITVRAGVASIFREGSGAGEATAATPGGAHEMASRAAETDATKRALSTFGNAFGLSLQERSRAAAQPTQPNKRVISGCYFNGDSHKGIPSEFPTSASRRRTGGFCRQEHAAEVRTQALA